MLRILRIAIVLTLVIGSVAAMNTFENSFSIVDTCSANGTNVTWDMLNQTIDELKAWIDGNFVFLANYLNETNNRINETVDEIKQNLTGLLYGNATANISFAEYLLDRMNVTVNVDDITLEGVNESNVLGKLDVIIDALGYNSINETVYQDLDDILNGLKDKNGYYILKDSSTGISNLAVLAAEFLIPTLENQYNLSKQVNYTFNATKTVIENHHTTTRNFMSSEAEYIVEHAGDPWAMITGVLLIILIFYFVVYKKFLKPRLSPVVYPDDYKRGQQEGGQQQYQERPPPQEQQYYDQPQPERRNPVTKVLNRNIPPSCFKDGVTYSGNDFQCSTCKFQNECIDAKIRQQGERQHDQQDLALQGLQSTATPEIQSTAPDDFSDAFGELGG